MTHFILCLDTAAVRSTRRKIALQSPGLGVVVGTWGDLLRLASSSWLLPPLQPDWQQRIEAAVKEAPDCFWSASLKAVPAEASAITGIINNALTMLLEGVVPGTPLPPVPQMGLSARTSRYLGDLVRLHQSMDNALPSGLATIRSLLELPRERMLRPILVYTHPDLAELPLWQQALIERLNQTAGSGQLSAIFDLFFVSETTASSNTALGHLQRNLFEQVPQKIGIDSSVQWLAVRDYLFEVETAAGLVQQALADDQTLQCRDIALLLPSDQAYHGAVAATFTRAGIPLSGNVGASQNRDLGREAVSLLLTCLDGLAPTMALASLLVSPLMPWDRQTANRLAQLAINSDFKLNLPEDSALAARDMAKLIRTRVATSAQLKQCLIKFPTLLSPAEELKPHQKKVQETCAGLVTLLEQADTIPWQELKAAAIPYSTKLPGQSECTLEGVALFHESEEPWKKVRRLFVLGCCDGHYPAKPAGFALFTDAELEQIQAVCGYRLATAAERNRRLRQQFRRQLCSVSEQATFLLSRREPSGKQLAPSASITFAAALFEGVSDVEDLVLELDTEAGRNAAIGLPLMPDQQPQPPHRPEPKDLSFDKNLLELDMKSDGSLKPESPSRLETLMVSPLAWLFERLSVKPLDWQPETLNVMSKGTLAHAVFEQLFAPGIALPDSSTIETEVPTLLDEQITSMMPFLNRSEWKVERKHLQQDILKSALQWREIMHQTGAKPVAVEIGLQGTFDGIPIHGNADLLLELPPNRLYVVDYKKSGSKDRRKRMKAGYDHQAELYRTMIKTGGLKEPEKAPQGLAEKLAASRDTGEIGTLYYLMNDQKALADTTGWLPGNIANLEEMQTNASANAMQLIKDRFSQVRQGKIELNTPADEKEFKGKRGISAYALKDNPLVVMWMNNKE